MKNKIMKTLEITGQLTLKEFAELPSGTKAKTVEIFDSDGHQYSSIFVLLDDPNFDEELEDAKRVAPGYFTRTLNVTRN